MNIDDKIRVTSCPLCEIFLNPKENIITKLYWPERIEDIPKSEFVIVDCDTCKIPMLILGEHITSVDRGCWGRILYMSKKIFGHNVRLRCNSRKILDHYHCHLILKEY